MIKKINHIGIAVNSIDEALGLYTDVFGLELEGIEIVEEQKVKTAFLPIDNTEFELLESTDKDGPVAKFIEKRGQGIQHIALAVSYTHLNKCKKKCSINNILTKLAKIHSYKKDFSII